MMDDSQMHTTAEQRFPGREMPRAKYLNFILTINAILLAALLWTQLAGLWSGGAGSASAQAPGLPNAGAQRQAMIQGITRIEQALEDANAYRQRGPIPVEVTNVEELRPVLPEL